mgnify:FL=1
MKQIRRALLLAVCLLTALSILSPAQASGKFAALPAALQVAVQSEERYEGDKTQYIYKEYLQTAHPKVDADIRQTVDGIDKAYSPLLIPQAQSRAKLYNRLDIEVNYFRTGDS